MKQFPIPTTIEFPLRNDPNPFRPKIVNSIGSFSPKKELPRTTITTSSNLDNKNGLAIHRICILNMYGKLYNKYGNGNHEREQKSENPSNVRIPKKMSTNEIYILLLIFSLQISMEDQFP